MRNLNEKNVINIHLLFLIATPSSGYKELLNMENLACLAKDLMKIAKETRYIWLTGIFAYGATAIYSDYKSDVVIICD